MSKQDQKRADIYQKRFIRLLAEKVDMPEPVAEELVNAFLQTLVSALLQNQSVCFPEFGVFELREVSERAARNPRTKEVCVIPLSMKPVFRPSRSLRDAVAECAVNWRKTAVQEMQAASCPATDSDAPGGDGGSWEEAT